MGRIGISYAEVAEAALALQAEGKVATVDAIRNRLGTGSKTTINQYLKQWKSEQENRQGSQLPKELHTVVMGLWERLQAECALKIEGMIEKHKSECENLQSTVTEAQYSQRTAEQAAQELTIRLDNSSIQNEHLQQELQQCKQALFQLEERYSTTMTQLTDSKAENTRLHQLASQIQKNLEHYQQAMEQLRTEQALENEKQHHQYQAQQATLTMKWQATEIELARTSETLNQTFKQVKQLSDANIALKIHSEQCDRENSVLQERLSQLQQTLENETTKTQHYQSHIHALEQQQAILQDQNARFTHDVEKMSNRLSLVEQQRNQLSIENAILQAQQIPITSE